MHKLQYTNNLQLTINKNPNVWNLVIVYCLLFVICNLFIVNSAFANPPSGFHEGPYILIGGGLLNFSADNNVRTGTKVGSDFEPASCFSFGWNLKDMFAPELEVRYATTKGSGSREHIVDVNLNAVYSLITDKFTSSNKIKFLPFLQAGPVIQLAAIPGDPASADQTIVLWGPGVSLGAGLKFLFMKFGYAGILAQSDIVRIPNKFQDIAGAKVKVINGGWDLQLGLMGMLGVHY